MKERIQEIIIKMLFSETLSVFADVLSLLVFMEEEAVKTAGVCFYSDKIVLYYNDSFIRKLNNKELTFLLIHEALHVLFRHKDRSNRVDSFLDNYAQDAIINTSIVNAVNVHNMVSPIEGSIFINNDYTGSEIFEAYYLWLKDNYQEKPNVTYIIIKGDKENKDKENKENEENEENSKEKESLTGIKVGFDVHMEDCCTEEEAELIAGDLYEIIKSKGSIPQNIEKLLNYTPPKQIDYLKIIKRTLSNTLLHSKRTKTFLRPNRYGIEGLKGSLYTSYEINCILDTSGSMFDDFEKVLAYLQNNKVVVNLIQIDTEVKEVKRITNTKKIDKITIKGGGGTILQPAINMITKNKVLNKYGTLILTDGYTDSLDLSNLHKSILIISSGIEAPIRKSRNNVTQILIKNGEK